MSSLVFLSSGLSTLRKLIKNIKDIKTGKLRRRILIFTSFHLTSGPIPLEVTIARVREVTINTIARTVVSFVKKLPALVPNRVSLPPPKALLRSPALPLCSNTTRISTRDTTTCRITSNVVIIYSLHIQLSLKTNPALDSPRQQGRHLYLPPP